MCFQCIVRKPITFSIRLNPNARAVLDFVSFNSIDPVNSCTIELRNAHLIQ